MKCTLILHGIAAFYCIQSNAQVKLWDGEGRDSLWSTAANWVDNIVPSSTDHVVLDNSNHSGNYVVKLPSGATTVTVKTIRIAPVMGDTIQLIIPSTNQAAPALAVSGPGYGIAINKGGIFQNSSGLANGISLVIADSIQINNGGRYIHNTRTVHATNIVQLLSRAPGTESGTFEFDIPSGGGTLSMSNRVYGNLVLSATAAGGARTYTASGSNTLTVNGNLIVQSGVTLSLDLASANGNVIIKGNLQNAGTINLASGAGDNSILKIAGHITQTTTGTLTESNTGLPSIELNGTIRQNISIAGSITNSIAFILNNPAGALLQQPLSLPYKLILHSGQLTTSSTNLLTLQNNCTVQADSLSSLSFINGPVKKIGLSSASRFLFPVGKDNMHRWLELKNATGNFTAEYQRASPYLLSPFTMPPIDHTSQLEYWTIKADPSPTASAIVSLSFDYRSSGGVTNLSKLLIARLNEGMWASPGTVATTGTATTNGSITANTIITDFDSIHGDLFTLATDISQANPLPLIDAIAAPRQAAQRNVLFTKLVSVAPSLIIGNTTLLTVLAVKEEQIRIVVTNQLGQPMKMQIFFLNKGSNKLALDISGLPFGIYHITGYMPAGRTNTIRCIKQ